MASAIKDKIVNAASGHSNGADTHQSGGFNQHSQKYLLRVTAGPSYDPSTHHLVRVNGAEAVNVENEFMSVRLRVRIQNYKGTVSDSSPRSMLSAAGLPKGSPKTSPYFSHPMHKNDQYSISYSFIPKKPIPGKDVVLGFDFDHPVRDRLPPGFKTAMSIVTKFVDPGIYADPYSDEPYLYGPALSSFFILRIGDKGKQDMDKESAESVIQEGADGSGKQIREQLGLPEDSEKRRKHFLKDPHKESFQFEAGRLYVADFFNPYLDFSNFALKLPGFSISVAKYIDEKTHGLRYVLKNRRTGDVYLVVIFTLLFGQELRDALRDDGEQGKASRSACASELSGQAGRLNLNGVDNAETVSASRNASVTAADGQGERVKRDGMGDAEKTSASRNPPADELHGQGRHGNELGTGQGPPGGMPSGSDPGRPKDVFAGDGKQQIQEQNDSAGNTENNTLATNAYEPDREPIDKHTQRRNGSASEPHQNNERTDTGAGKQLQPPTESVNDIRRTSAAQLQDGNQNIRRIFDNANSTPAERETSQNHDSAGPNEIAGVLHDTAGGETRGSTGRLSLHAPEGLGSLNRVEGGGTDTFLGRREVF